MKRLVLAAVTGAVLAGVSLTRITRPVGVIEGLERAQPERVFVARLSKATEYHPCTEDPAFADSLVQRESCAAPKDTRYTDQLTTAGESLDPDSLRASALAEAIWGDREDAVALDAAIERLSNARALARNQVPILVELSALHLERAGHGQNTRDVWQALDYADEALEHEPGHLPALFNAALATQALYLREGAEKAWDDYLRADSDSPWAEEAKRRRGAIREGDQMLPADASSSPAQVTAFANAHPQRARELGWETVLREWGKAVLESRPARADSLLAFAKRLGEGLTSHGGDASLADAVQSIRAVRGDQAALRNLARSHHAYAAGRELFAASSWSMAGDSFRLVLQLDPASPSLLSWTRAEYAAVPSGTTDPDEAKRVLRVLLATTDTVRHPALAARLTRILAFSLSRADSSTVRLLHFGKAAATYARLREWESYAGSRSMETWAAHEAGDTVEAYRMMTQTLRALRLHRESINLHNVLLEAAELTGRDGMHRAALRLQAEDGVVAMGVRNLTVAAEALMARARMRALADSAEQGAQDLDAAERLIKTLNDTTVAAELKEQLRFSRLVVSPPKDAGVAAVALDSAMDYLARKNTAWPVMMLAHRIDRHLKDGDLGGADTDLDDLTARIRDAPGFHFRSAVMERVRSRYDRLVMGYVRGGQPLAALLALDRGRLSFVQAADSGTSRRTWTAPPPGHVVLEYALIGDTLLTWVVRRDSVTLREQRLDSGELPHTIARLDIAFENGQADTRPGLRRLYDVLIRPVRDRIPPGAELVIVADGEIAGVPFPALLSGAGADRHLVHDHPIRAVSTLADATRTASPVGPGPALLISNPAFDQRENAKLERLPGAAAEVEGLGQFYPDTIRLDDTTATVSAFRDRAPGTRVIHYAGHAVFDNSRPERSFLLLTGDGTSGRLTADSVDSMNLKGVQLVVLSACRTLRGRQGRSGGFAGFSGALLNAGADGVVASQWLVSDELAQPLMVELHRRYREGETPARSLRNAQLEMIRIGQPIRAWAAFRYVGR
jgi:CHAT domain-containing protein/tetratricopeptide (TPR) repeat protein